MPSQRKRIGFLPSEEVHEIIDKLCKAYEFSQSKVTGLLVEEALRSRGVLSNSFANNKDIFELSKNVFEQKLSSKKNNFTTSSDVYRVNEKVLSDDIKLMHEFIEFKYFKNVMKQNKNIFE